MKNVTLLSAVLQMPQNTERKHTWQSTSREEEHTLQEHTSLTHETFLFLVCLIMATRGRPVTWREEPPPQQILAPQPVAWGGLCGIRGDGRGHVALSHWSSCALQTREPETLALTESSICQGIRARHAQSFQVFFFSGYVTKLKKTRNIQHNSKVFSSSQHTVTWWTGYVFEPSMNMKHPSRFNPALLSHSTRPIRSLWPAPQGELIEVLGWTYWVFGGEPWLAGHWHVQISGSK